MAENGKPARRAKESELLIVANGLKVAILKNYLPFAFFIAIVVALSWPYPGRKVGEPEVQGVHVITFIEICLVFFISGLTLRTDELALAFQKESLVGTLFGFISILGLTPLLGWAVRDLSFSPPEFATGLTIFCVVPTTLGIGVSLVQSAKGNVALAIFLTVGSNLLGVLLIPLWLKAILSGAAKGVEALSIDLADIFVKLLISFLVPTVIGKGLRELCPPVQRWVKQNRTLLSLINNTSLALIIWETISSGRETIVNTKFGNMLVVVCSTILIHFIYLAFNTLMVYLLRIPLLEAISTVIMASQKSAPVAVTVITYIAKGSSSQGVLALPCVVGQVAQIFVGQPIANYLGGRVQRWHAEQADLKEAAAARELADQKAVDV